MRGSGGAGRVNQRRRTRKDLLDAAARLLKQGDAPSLEEIAQEASVSRATAYRYFPNVEALLLEAALHVSAPDGSALDGAPDDPVVRLERIDAAFDAMISANEAPLRLMLAHTLQGGPKLDGTPARQNRRTPLIEAALAPARADFDPKAYEALRHTLAILIGTESFVVTKDVLQLDRTSARKVRRWAIRALVEAARRPSGD